MAFDFCNKQLFYDMQQVGHRAVTIVDSRAQPNKGEVRREK
jgi:hypothetical protein